MDIDVSDKYAKYAKAGGYSQKPGTNYVETFPPQFMTCMSVVPSIWAWF